MFFTITVWRIFMQQTGSESKGERFPVRQRVASENRNSPAREILMEMALLLGAVLSMSSFHCN